MMNFPQRTCLGIHFIIYLRCPQPEGSPAFDKPERPYEDQTIETGQAE